MTVTKDQVELLGELLLIQLEPVEEKTMSGIFIPTTNTVCPNRATVIKTGIMKDGTQFPLSVGDKILFENTNKIEKIQLDCGEEYAIIKLDQVLLKY
jgi:co-chaperonin GroES (HSP10)